MKFISGSIFILIPIVCLAQPNLCTYSTYEWNTKTRSADNYREIKKTYTELTDTEIDSITGCTVCREDQVTLQINPQLSVQLCYVIADQVKHALDEAITNGQVIQELTGYRVGKTRGEIDEQELRTQFSNHSFGTALDVNTSHNGLYDNCLSFSKTCRLIKGGEWREGNHLSITHSSAIVNSMKEAGFLWGGTIQGKQKDFMHFSISGY